MVNLWDRRRCVALSPHMEMYLKAMLVLEVDRGEIRPELVALT